jgi:predicted amidophosphoribosyltransferase
MNNDLCDNCQNFADRIGEYCFDCAEKNAKSLIDEIECLTAERDAARNMLEGICSEFERTIAHADWKADGSKGMSVPFHGDFASAVQLPSIVGKMRWWSRQMRKVIGEKAE